MNLKRECDEAHRKIILAATPLLNETGGDAKLNYQEINKKTISFFSRYLK